MKRPEQALHIAVAQFLAMSLRAPSFWTTVDHGAGRLSRASAGLMKARGVKRGLPDILVLHPGVPSLWIELKAKRGSLSVDQIKTHATIFLAGGLVCTCRSLEEVSSFLRRHGVPVYGAVQGIAA